MSNEQTKALLYSFLVFVFISCSTPEKALENKNYVNAMNLATKQISKGKNIEENEKFLRIAAESLAKENLESYQNNKSENVKDWKKSQTRFNSALKHIGDKNIKTKGLVSDSYNKLCDVKYDLDLRIIDYYYDEGTRLLTKSKSLDESQWARDAFYEFKSSQKEGASEFYPNIEKLKEDCIKHGTILVSAPIGFNLNSFFVKSTRSTESKPDCIIRVDEGFVNFSEPASKSRETKKKEIKVGQNAVTDTSGVTTYEDIIEEIEGFKDENEIIYTARQTLTIRVIAKNSECFLRGRTIILEESEKCTEVEYSGDERVFITTIENKCADHIIKSSLESDLRRELRKNLSLY